MRENTNKLRKDNEGSAIVTVLVIVAFVTILATAILYLALNNYKMKMTERKTEEMFYQTETTLEEIKTGLALELGKACEEAYIEILPIYASSDASTRQAIFLTRAVDKIEKNWKNNTNYLASDTDAERRNKIATYLKSISNAKMGLNIEFTGEFDTSHAADGYYLLKGVEVVYVKDDYYSRITTDFIINYPSISFAVDNDTSVTDPSTHERESLKYTDYVHYMNWKKE